MSTSYGAPGGTGNRTSTITVTVGGGFAGSPSTLVNGAFANESWFTGCTRITFQFTSARIIDEAAFYQQTGFTSTHGTWKWQGSNDGSAWTDIGGTFVLGGVATQVITTLAGNTTAYIYYRLELVSGATSNAPYIWEFEFKIDGVGDPTAARLSQAPVEVLLGSLPAPTARLSQLPIEVLHGDPVLPVVRLSQLPIEVLRTTPSRNLRFSHLVVEALITEVVPAAGLRASHIVIDVLGDDAAQPPALRASHVVAEALVTDSAILLLFASHMVVDVLVKEPDTEETVFDPNEAPVGLTWIEFTDYEGHLHIWSNIALPDPVSYFGGYKEHRVVEFNTIRRALSNIDGQYEGIVWTWVLSG